MKLLPTHLRSAEPVNYYCERKASTFQQPDVLIICLEITSFYYFVPRESILGLCVERKTGTRSLGTWNDAHIAPTPS